jgi:hypothetical protein
MLNSNQYDVIITKIDDDSFNFLVKKVIGRNMYEETIKFADLLHSNPKACLFDNFSLFVDFIKKKISEAKHEVEAMSDKCTLIVADDLGSQHLVFKISISKKNTDNLSPSELLDLFDSLSLKVYSIENTVSELKNTVCCLQEQNCKSFL